jgi:putative transposase
MSKSANPFRCFNSSPEVIRLVVMMYVRYPLSLRNVENLLFERGIDICHETVRLWWNRFGPLFAADIRRQRVSRMRGFRHWRWHIDEVFVKKALKRHGRAETIVTDGLRSYPAAMRILGNLERREMGRWLNNRAENSRLPFRQRERAMLRFRRMKTLQKFASVHAGLHNHFNSERHLVDRQTYKIRRSAALAGWQSLAA